MLIRSAWAISLTEAYTPGPAAAASAKPAPAPLIVSVGQSHVTVWTFAGGASSSSVARELAAFDLTVTGFSEFSIHLRGTSAAAVADRIRRIDPQLARPQLPDDLAGALKFGLCLPERVVVGVLSSRTADLASVREIVSRESRIVSVIDGDNLRSLSAGRRPSSP